jgi:FkbM family methyltransferase
MSALFRSIGRHWHQSVARAPRLVAGAYLRTLSRVARCLPPGRHLQQLQNSVQAAQWPELELPPKRVRVAHNVEFLIQPHLGEFDAEALFRREITYESSVFQVLGSRIPTYDTIIEIGANVGVFTLFFATLFQRHGKSLDRIFCFEPSDEAYWRLQTNLKLNGFQAVQALKCAVGTEGGVAAFHEPQGHLTNGSLSREFSAQFSSEIRQRHVPIICAQSLESMLSPGRSLIKIDAEGAEALILGALASILDKWKPDLTLEVLPGFERELQSQVALASYVPFHIDSTGMKQAASINASGERDMFFVHKANLT